MTFSIVGHDPKGGAVGVGIASRSFGVGRAVEEVADLWFHSYVLLAARGLDPALVEDALLRRAG